MPNNSYLNGVKMTDEQLLKDGMDLLASAAGHLYDVDGDHKVATLAWMVDNCLKYGECILKDKDPRSANWDE